MGPRAHGTRTAAQSSDRDSALIRNSRDSLQVKTLSREVEFAVDKQNKYAVLTKESYLWKIVMGVIVAPSRCNYRKEENGFC